MNTEVLAILSLLFQGGLFLIALLTLIMLFIDKFKVKK